METMFGVLLGYVLRGTTGSQGFRKVVESARAVTGSEEFQNMIDATKSHAAHVIRDLTETLSNGGEQLAAVLGQPSEAGGEVEAADWETWPPAPRRADRPFSDDLPWPDR